MLEDIQIFAAIAQHQSFSKAAERLGMSTSVMTRRLARLEKHLGVHLISRTTRRLHLTDAGQLFFAEIDEILKSLETAKDVVRNLTQGVNGTVKVGIPANFCTLYLTKVLHQFLTKYPRISLQIVTGANFLDLAAKGFDVVLHCGTLPDSSFYAKKIGSWKKILCATPQYLAKNGIPKTLDDLRNHNCIDDYNNFERTWEFLQDNVLQKIMIDGNVRIEGKLDIKNLILNDVGIAYLPKFIIQAELQSGQLVPVLESLHSPEFNSYIVYANNKFLTKKTQVFIDFLLQTLAPVYKD